MLNESLFNELVEASRDLPGNRWAVGGNAPVMAARMATEGCDVLLGGSFSPDFTDVLSQHITGTQTHQCAEGLVMHRFTLHCVVLFPFCTECGRPLSAFSGRPGGRRARHSSDLGVSVWCKLGAV